MIIKQRVLPNARLGDDIGIWEGSIIYEILYLVFVAEAIVSPVARFLIEVAVFIEVPSRRHGIRHRRGI